MTIKAIATSDSKSELIGSFSRVGVQIGGRLYCRWFGFANILAGVTSSAIDITIPSEQRGLADTVGLMIPANSQITRIALFPEGALTLGAATGKLKFASSLAAATVALYVESAAASGGVLAAPTNWVDQINTTSTTVGSSDVTYKLFATDGAAGASAAASTVTATKDTRVLVCIDFINYAPLPLSNQIPKITPKV